MHQRLCRQHAATPVATDPGLEGNDHACPQCQAIEQGAQATLARAMARIDAQAPVPLADVPNTTLADLLDAETRALVQDSPEALALLEETVERLRR